MHIMKNKRLIRHSLNWFNKRSFEDKNDYWELGQTYSKIAEF